jgi:hypothetical protein
MMRKLFFFAPVAVVMVVAGTGRPGVINDKIKHPRLHVALHELVQAHQELKDAGAGLGGHRQKALAAIDDAIKSVRLVLEVKGADPNVVVRKGDFYRKYKNYPHLRQVLLDLKEARGELQDTKANFNSHRQRAIKDINLAINEIQLAIEHARD